MEPTENEEMMNDTKSVFRVLDKGPGPKDEKCHHPQTQTLEKKRKNT
jgi:hypothetical protein